MVEQRNNKKPGSSWVPPFFSGLVLGAISISCVYYFGVVNFDPDTEFLKTFPDFDKTFPNITFEFPEQLQETDPDRVGADRKLDTPQVEILEPPNTPEDTAPELDEEVADETRDDTPPSNVSESITGYVLQAGAFSEKKHADSFRASLLIEGYNAFTKQISDASSDVQFRVIVGPYDTVEASREDSERLKDRNVSTFIVPMREISQ